MDKKSSLSKIVHAKPKSKSKDVACERCHKVFPSKAHLRNHVDAVHLKLKNFWCQQCDYACYFKRDLTKHVEDVHLKIKKYKCAECGHTFAQKRHLKEHIQAVHWKLKKFTCGECARSFAKKSNLTKHIRGVHRRADVVVDSAFSPRKSFKTNLSTARSQSKRFTCDGCDYASSFKTSLKIHQDTVHARKTTKLKSFFCGQCFNAFGTRPDLMAHISEVHPPM